MQQFELLHKICIAFTTLTLETYADFTQVLCNNEFMQRLRQKVTALRIPTGKCCIMQQFELLHECCVVVCGLPVVADSLPVRWLNFIFPVDHTLDHTTTVSA